MQDTIKLNQVLDIIEEMETYLKVLAVDYKLNRQDANELYNYIKKAKDVAYSKNE